eukprot:3160611-Rhodomonas_salina.3
MEIITISLIPATPTCGCASRRMRRRPKCLNTMRAARSASWRCCTGSRVSPLCAPPRTASRGPSTATRQCYPLALVLSGAVCKATTHCAVEHQHDWESQWRVEGKLQRPRTRV